MMRYAALLLALLLVSCGRAPELVGIDNPEIPVRSVETATRHKVFIATTREDSEVVGALFSSLRANELGLASVEVSVPPTHEVGKIERPRSLPPDPRTDFAIIEPTIYTNEPAFISSLNAELRTRPPGARDVVFFVHGYNNTTSDAILQVAQFVEDSGFDGVPVLFTWASAGQVSRYVYDLNSALIARPRIIEAADIIAQSVATDYHVFAHSMGGFLTMEAIVDAVQVGRFNRSDRLRNVILASPDIDVDLFQTQMSQVDGSFDRFFVLLAQDDAALRASRVIAGGVPRVGAADADALSQLGVTAIDLSEIDDSRTGSHSKFAGSPEIVQLIGIGLNTAPQYGIGRRPVLDQFLGDLPIRVVGGG
ncbi:MAG: alpha/beta hydrolase [Pseudomonadota bacterium]